jgi:death on curing protein
VRSPVWISHSAVLALHDEQLSQHGGAEGVRDNGLLESALARPQNFLAYGDEPTLHALAAAYAAAIVRNHPFVDGNKRTSFVVCATFLGINSLDLVAPEIEAPPLWGALAAGDLEEAVLTDWLGKHTQPL